MMATQSNLEIADMFPRLARAIEQSSTPMHANLGSAEIHEEEQSLSEDEGVEAYEFSDEDAQSLFQPSISRLATRLASNKTPAAEKAAAMEDIEGGGYFDSDGEATPPVVPNTVSMESSSLGPDLVETVQERTRPRPDLNLGNLPPASVEDSGFPTPWQSGPKPMIIQRPEESRSALREAFITLKPRSFSGSGDAIRKFLPSMPKAGSFMDSLPSPSFFSSGTTQKARSRASTVFSRSPGSSSPDKAPTLDRVAHTAAAPPATPKNSSNSSNTTLNANPPIQHSHLRRVNSDDSMLYHSLSRASSLGDDTRFENHHEMINSRVKAIRDTFQDRSSFRLPNIPSMPRVPSFDFAMSFVSNFAGTSLPAQNDADTMKGILPIHTKKTPGMVPSSVISPGMVGASVSRPEAVIESTKGRPSSPESVIDRAISNLTGDVVIMGGYRGSILRSAKPPHRQLWVPVKVGLNIRKVNMEVGLEPEDEERMEDHIFSSGMIQHVGPVDISKRLFKRLRDSENARNGTLRVWDYGYDWRLSPHLLSKKLTKFLEGLPSNIPGSDGRRKGAFVIAHSLGGLITRHAVNKRPELFSGVVYAGVPQSCINILGPLRNGDAVLLSSRVLTAQVNFTLRTSFVLLPLDGYGFIDQKTKESYLVDFFNVDDWIKYRWSPCTDPPLPPKNPPAGSLANILKSSRTGSFTNLTLPGRKSSNAASKKPTPNSSSTNLESANESHHSRTPPLATRAIEAVEDIGSNDRSLAPQMGSQTNPVSRGHSTSTSISTTVTIPRAAAITYLRRTLAETKAFKIELAHNTTHETSNVYPPIACIYGKSVPTVYAARVDGRDGIPCADCYDDLAFASGDGVCLAKEAMVPDGYKCVQGGRISSDRGHVTLLGDLNAVGKAIEAVVKGRNKGLGLGVAARSGVGADHAQE